MLDSSNNFGGLNAAGQAAFSNPYSTQPNPVNPISSRYSPDTIIPPKPVAPTPIKAAPLPISSRYTPDSNSTALNTAGNAAFNSNPYSTASLPQSKKTVSSIPSIDSQINTTANSTPATTINEKNNPNMPAQKTLETLSNASNSFLGTTSKAAGLIPDLLGRTFSTFISTFPEMVASGGKENLVQAAQKAWNYEPILKLVGQPFDDAIQANPQLGQAVPFQFAKSITEELSKLAMMMAGSAGTGVASDFIKNIEIPVSPDTTLTWQDLSDITRGETVAPAKMEAFQKLTQNDTSFVDQLKQGDITVKGKTMPLSDYIKQQVQGFSDYLKTQKEAPGFIKPSEFWKTKSEQPVATSPDSETTQNKSLFPPNAAVHPAVAQINDLAAQNGFRGAVLTNTPILDRINGQTAPAGVDFVNKTIKIYQPDLIKDIQKLPSEGIELPNGDVTHDPTEYVTSLVNFEKEHLSNTTIADLNVLRTGTEAEKAALTKEIDRRAVASYTEKFPPKSTVTEPRNLPAEPHTTLPTTSDNGMPPTPPTEATPQTAPATPGDPIVPSDVSSPDNTTNKVEFKITGNTDKERVQSAITNSVRIQNELSIRGKDAVTVSQGLSPHDIKLAEQYEQGESID